jgi:lipoprotein-anchoring transpeptidase ErfK/SrfK
MRRPIWTFWPLAAAALAFLPAGGLHAQGFQSGSGAAQPPRVADPTSDAPEQGLPFQSVGTPGDAAVAVPPVAAGAPAAAVPAAAALATATSSAPTAPPVTEPTTSTVPAFTSRPAPAVAPVVPAPDSSQPAAAALAFSSVSSPNAGRSVGAGGAGPLLPASDGSGPAFEFADRIVIEKGARRLYLLRGDDVIVEYPVKLGLNPYGHKQREGDFRTPEGTYHLSRRNPRSEFFLSVEVSYPNEADRARARQSGVRPGGLIMIHGQPNVPRKTPDYYASNDWTDGCIAVSNSDMVDIWQRTRLGMPIEIRP